ncbi:MAG: hypothetical protein MUE96_06895 [Bacteroidia bacterium]|jgi:hypothetical protein|nr:hypothetical protein [Bacteroidia bacterium]
MCSHPTQQQQAIYWSFKQYHNAAFYYLMQCIPALGGVMRIGFVGNAVFGYKNANALRVLRSYRQLY